MKRLTALLASITVLVVGEGRADRIDDLVSREMAKRRIPGLALTVLRNGDILTTRTYGFANLETEAPLRTSSVFELASLTKPFTAAAIMLLVEDGKIGLDEPISRFINGTPEKWGTIKVRHLLTHTAGFEELGTPTCEGADLMDVSTNLQFAFIRKAPRLFAPGEGASYSDPGYFLLGLIIEKVSGRRYAQFMEERIFSPLGMLSTSVLDQRRIIKGRVSPYAVREGELRRGRRDWQHELPSFFGIFSTIEDLAKWEKGLVRGSLLSRPALEDIWTPARLNDGSVALVYGQPYGYGWQLGDYRGRKTVEHGGFTGTYMLRLPEDGLTVIVLSNLDNASGNSPVLVARGLAGLVDPKYLPAHLLEPSPDPDPARTAKILDFLHGFGEDGALAMMTAEHRRFFLHQPEEVRRGMAGLFKAVKTVTYLDEDDVRNRRIERLGIPVARIAYFRSEADRGFRYFSFWLTAEGSIAYMVNYPY